MLFKLIRCVFGRTMSFNATAAQLRMQASRNSLAGSKRHNLLTKPRVSGPNALGNVKAALAAQRAALTAKNPVTPTPTSSYASLHDAPPLLRQGARKNSVFSGIKVPSAPSTPRSNPSSSRTTSPVPTPRSSIFMGGKRRNTRRKNNRKNNRKNKSRKH